MIFVEFCFLSVSGHRWVLARTVYYYTEILLVSSFKIRLLNLLLLIFDKQESKVNITMSYPANYAEIKIKEMA